MIISPRARWVVCPLGHTRGHGRRVIYPLGFDNRIKKFQCRSWPNPAAQRPLGPGRGSGKNKEICSFFLYIVRTVLVAAQSKPLLERHESDSGGSAAVTASLSSQVDSSLSPSHESESCSAPAAATCLSTSSGARLRLGVTSTQSP